MSVTRQVMMMMKGKKKNYGTEDVLFPGIKKYPSLSSFFFLFSFSVRWVRSSSKINNRGKKKKRFFGEKFKKINKKKDINFPLRSPMTTLAHPPQPPDPSSTSGLISVRGETHLTRVLLMLPIDRFRIVHLRV